MSMLPAKVDWPFPRGTSGALAAIGFVPQDSNGQPVSLTGCTVVMVAAYAPLNLRIMKTSADGSLTIDLSTSTIMWPAPTAAEVTMIPLGSRMSYYFNITFPDGSVLRPMEGLFIGSGV